MATRPRKFSLERMRVLVDCWWEPEEVEEDLASCWLVEGPLAESTRSALVSSSSPSLKSCGAAVEIGYVAISAWPTDSRESIGGGGSLASETAAWDGEGSRSAE